MSPLSANAPTCESRSDASIENSFLPKSTMPTTSTLQVEDGDVLRAARTDALPSSARIFGSGTSRTIASSMSTSVGVPQPILAIGPNT